MINKIIIKKIRKDIKKFYTKVIKRTIEINRNIKILSRNISVGKCEISKLRDKNGNVTSITYNQITIAKNNDQFIKKI